MKTKWEQTEAGLKFFVKKESDWQEVRPDPQDIERGFLGGHITIKDVIQLSYDYGFHEGNLCI